MDSNHKEEGPFVGSRCIAGPGQLWGEAHIRGLNADGTFKIEYTKKEFKLLDFWYGVPLCELSFNDERLWEPVFKELSAGGQTLEQIRFQEILTRLGYTVSEVQALEAWDAVCKNIYPDQALPAALNMADSYKLLLNLNLSAKRCGEILRKDAAACFKLYWNQGRMGGRDPSDLPRPVTLSDAYAALGLPADSASASALKLMDSFQRRNAVRLPRACVEFFSRSGVAEAVHDCHQNNPDLVPLDTWALRRDLRKQKLHGDCALNVMLPHQGDHEWFLVFDDGEDDARVYVRFVPDDGSSEVWLYTAPSIGHFFWDLAQTGIGWFLDNAEFTRGKAALKSDIGYVLDMRSTLKKWFGL